MFRSLDQTISMGNLYLWRIVFPVYSPINPFQGAPINGSHLHPDEDAISDVLVEDAISNIFNGMEVCSPEWDIISTYIEYP